MWTKHEYLCTNCDTLFEITTSNDLVIQPNCICDKPHIIRINRYDVTQLTDYPEKILRNAVTAYMKNYVNAGRAFGELGHPEGPTVNLDKVSHLIKDLSFNGTVCEGKAKILTNTPMGKIASSLIEEGAKLGVSSRGMGSLREFQGVNHVQEDFMLAAVDIVADPSAPGAFVNGIMEGKEWVWNNGIMQEVQISNYKKAMNNVSRKDLEQTQLKIFEHFLSKIKEL